jgi:DNA-binding beta-propeller fold protein YncE
MTRRISLPLVSLVIVAAALAIGLSVQAQTPATVPSAAQSSGPLAVLASYPVGGEGRWDLQTVDEQAGRVYIARETRVMVVDAATGKLVGELPGVNGAHGVAVVPELGLGFATAGKDNVVVVFDLKTIQEKARIKTGTNPDAILYDPFSKKVYALNGRSNDATIIDPSALDKAPVTLPLGGKPELGVSDGAGRIYVNLEDKSEIVAIDATAAKVLAHWPLAPGEEPSGLAIDVAHKRLFAACGGNQKMIVVDATTGKVLGDAPIGTRVDGAAFNAKLGLALASNGDATLTAVKEGPDGKFVVAQTLQTVKGARTITVDSKTNKAYLPCSKPAADGGKNVFNVLVVGEAAEAK